MLLTLQMGSVPSTKYSMVTKNNAYKEWIATGEMFMFKSEKLVR